MRARQINAGGDVSDQYSSPALRWHMGTAIRLCVRIAFKYRDVNRTAYADEVWVICYRIQLRCQSFQVITR